MAKTIKPEVLEVLRNRLEIDKNLVRITGQLDRDLYVGVADVLKFLGGKWKGGKVQATVFPEDKNPQELIDNLLAGGDKIEKNPLAYFPTPRSIVEDMAIQVETAGCGAFPYCRILEPSAGEGAIADYLVKGLNLEYCTHPDYQLDLIEFDPYRAGVLRKKGYSVIEADFLAVPVPPVKERYDAILMNPPFTIKNKTDVWKQHVLHAYEFLASGGVLVAIVPAGFMNQAHEEFRKFVSRNGTWNNLPEGAFKESGTGVRCMMITLCRPEDEPELEPVKIPVFETRPVAAVVPDTQQAEVILSTHKKAAPGQLALF